MNNVSPIIFWILTVLLLVLSIVFFPSLFSIFGIITAALLAPIEEWQDLIKQRINKPIKSAVIAVCVAFVIAMFPFPRILIGFNNFIKEATYSQNSSKLFNEEKPNSSSNFFTVNSNDDTEFFDNTDDFNTEDEFNQSSDNEYSDDSTTSNATSKNTYTSSQTISNNTTSKDIYSSSKQQSPATSSSKKPSSSVEANQNNKNYVYRTPSGKRYHYSETCGGKNSYKVSLKDALESKLTPCKKCAE
jgi:lipopolysaccharide export LptBFGC system permease protein LptF